MVSLDDAVIARLEKGGSRYEILVDPDLVAQWKENPENVDFEEMLATDEVWSDARAGDRPTAEALQNIFGTTELVPCVERILRDGSIQLTTMQRKKMVENKRKQIINAIATTATDPKTGSPHPPIRIEHALDEARFSVDPFLSVERQVQDAVTALRPLIPLQFITVRLAFRVSDKDTVILSGQKGSSLDPSRSEEGLTSKIGIDATLPPGIDRSPYESVL